MHIIFERSSGRFESNCNILALAWMPYYKESAFRRAHLEYHHILLSHLTGPASANRPADPAPAANGQYPNGIQELLRQHSPRSAQPQTPVHSNRADRSSFELSPHLPNLGHQNEASASAKLDFALKRKQLPNSRLYEQYQRYVYMRYGRPQALKCPPETVAAETSDAAINDYIDELYGRQADFGWLAIGNIGRMVGVTLTSTVQAPVELDGRKPSSHRSEDCKSNQDDLIVLDDDTVDNAGENVKKAANQSSTTDKTRQATSTIVDSQRPDRKCSRDNHNLRGHLDEIILVKWNELYQKLATVDSKGNVLIWSKTNDKFTIQTPFYNKSKSVADFKWSNDGKTALICYTDSFILVGGSSGQRHWHSMLNLDDYHITCATWAPNDEQLLLGVSNGNVVIIDLPTSELTELMVGQANIRTMCWSSSDINLRHLGSCEQAGGSAGAGKTSPGLESAAKVLTGSVGFSRFEVDGDEHQSARQSFSSAVVSRRRLSRNCALFCRYRPRSPRRSSPSGLTTEQYSGPKDPSQSYKDILSIDFADNTIKLFAGGLNDPKPREIQVNLESYLMAWSSDGKVLAVAGFNIYTSAPSVGYLRCKYLNVIKFYNQAGELIYRRNLRFTRYPITALTWAHDDKRLFVATGPRLHCAKVFMGVPKLSLLSLSCLQRHTKLMDKTDVLKNLIKKQLVTNVLNWQSFNCPIYISSNCEPRAQSSAAGETARQNPECDQRGEPSKANHSNMKLCPLSTDESGSGSSCGGGTRCESKDERANLMNNINIANYQLPAKLKLTIDHLFLQTVRQPFDGQLNLNDVAWLVPKNNKRLYCTLICYTHEMADAGCVGQQYKAHELMSSDQKQSSLAGAEGRDSDQFKIFILYVEFQGSLIPILKARRVGFLKPEFVVFEPEDQPRNLIRNQKVSDVSNPSRHPQARQHRRGDNMLNSNCVVLHGPSCGMEQTLLLGLKQKRVMNDASYKPFTHSPLHPGHIQSRSVAASPTASGTSFLGNCHKAGCLILQDPNLSYLQSLTRQHSMMSPQIKTLKAIELLNRASSRHSSAQVSKQSLPENSELIRIKSNIWGTKFKLISMVNRRSGTRATLGSMRYKASLLHLQPRQIFLTLKDMSNYCALCSVHHHTKMASRSSQTKRATPPVTTTNQVSGLGFLDMPINVPVHYATPSRTTSRRAARSRHKFGQKERLNSDTEEKVILQVGDNIRIAPKLEPNQKYRFANSFDSASSSRSSNDRSGPFPLSTATHSRRARSKQNKAEVPNQISFESARSSSLIAQDSGNESAAAMSSEQDSDILTLSLDQRDCVQVEMTSSSQRRSSSLEPEPAQNNQRNEQKLDQFLQANKTLKSIQAITKMIVDLSSKADEDEDSSRPGFRNHPSPAKVLKTTDESGEILRSPRREYIPPETPVHRPRRFASNNRAEWLQRTQSATNSPLMSQPINAKKRSRRDGANFGKQATLQLELPLPPPPPPVPLRRRLSTSAKRFFDGSLRSLASMSGTGGSNTTIYLTSDELDSEECGSLFQRPSRSRTKARRSNHQSQPCTPLQSARADLTERQPILDLASLRTHVVQKLRQSTSWMSSARQLSEASYSSAEPTSVPRRERLNRPKARSQSCTKRSGWVHRDVRRDKFENRQDALESSSPGSSSSSSSDLISLISSPDSSSVSSVSSDVIGAGREQEFGFLDQNVRSKLFKKSSKLSSSTREFGCKKSSTPKRDALFDMNSFKRKLDVKLDLAGAKRPRQRRRRARKSICQSANCCCAKEFKMSNRPPVWNEFSQVYQLDFGGRVTQESAKNLQIDFNGNLALQFGRIDKCTYTLDYQFPFNAVQAMSVALASLTQRLK